ncbi:type VI secretion system tip protein VgrG [Aquabacter sp. CN5-332]|uniref:type VI secretion system Vgr family protein n=1 Tax=Aquabacter sp. CN5-332 TaxID=3156608 RepID=UPI0032B4E658
MAVDLKLKLSIAKIAGATGEAVTHFDCRAIKGREAISEPYRFEASFLASDATLSTIRGKTIVGKKGWLTISAGSQDNFGSGTDSTSPPNASIFAGIILEFRVDAIMNAQGQYACYAVLAPSISALNYNQVSNIFATSEVSKTDFIKGLLSSNPDNSTTGGHQQSLEFNVSSSINDIKIELPDNITKYNETDFSFFSRMVEHYGIFYYFEHGKPGSGSANVKSDYRDKIRIGAQNADFLRFSSSPVVTTNNATTATDLLNPCVLSFSQVQRPHAKSFVVRDYNETGPASDMLASSEVVGLNEGQDNDGIGSIVEYGDHFADHNEGVEFAKIRAQELAWQASVFEGESTLMGLHAGMMLQIKGFSSSSAEEYLVVSIEHSAAASNYWHPDLGLAKDERYRNRFVAIPSSLQFRPKRQTPRPVMAGVFNAVVAGAPKKRAVLDGEDKYHVNLQFDESDKKHAMGTLNPSSVAVRQIEPYASSGVDGVASGLHFPLVPNTEVLMAYVNGDPDRPIIVGAAFNSINQNLVKSASSTANRLRTAAGTLLEMEDGSVTEAGGKETRGPRYLRMDVPVSYNDAATSGTYFRMGAQASDETKDGKNVVATGLTYTASGVDATGAGMTSDPIKGSGKGIQLYSQDDLDVNVRGAGLMKFGKGHTTETSTGDSTHTVSRGQYVLTAQGDIIITAGAVSQTGGAPSPDETALKSAGAQPSGTDQMPTSAQMGGSTPKSPRGQMGGPAQMSAAQSDGAGGGGGGDGGGSFTVKSQGPTKIFTYGTFTKYTAGESFTVFLGAEQTLKAAMSMTVQLGAAFTVTLGRKTDIIIGGSTKTVLGSGDMKVATRDAKILAGADLKLARSDSKILIGEDFKVSGSNKTILMNKLTLANLATISDKIRSHVGEISIGKNAIKTGKNSLESKINNLTVFT